MHNSWDTCKWSSHCSHLAIHTHVRFFSGSQHPDWHVLGIVRPDCTGNGEHIKAAQQHGMVLSLHCSQVKSLWWTTVHCTHQVEENVGVLMKRRLWYQFSESPKTYLHTAEKTAKTFINICIDFMQRTKTNNPMYTRSNYGLLFEASQRLTLQHTRHCISPPSESSRSCSQIPITICTCIENPHIYKSGVWSKSNHWHLQIFKPDLCTQRLATVNKSVQHMFLEFFKQYAQTAFLWVWTILSSSKLFTEMVKVQPRKWGRCSWVSSLEVMLVGCVHMLRLHIPDSKSTPEHSNMLRLWCTGWSCCWGWSSGGWACCEWERTSAST